MTRLPDSQILKRLYEDCPNPKCVGGNINPKLPGRDVERCPEGCDKGKLYGVQVMSDPVDRPAHYVVDVRGHGEIELGRIIQAAGLPFLEGNAAKYIFRAGKKGGNGKRLEDMRKAARCIQLAIEDMEDFS